MKQVCLQCWRESPVGSLWCQESYCATDDKPSIFEQGDTVGQIQIIKNLAVLPAASVYEAERAGEKILLKVAHEGYQERLKREAALMLGIQNRKIKHPALPFLLGAYIQAKIDQYPYGKTSVNGEARYYIVFEHQAGESLRDILLNDPQPWYQHAVWLILEIADVLALMHKFGRLHLCLSPELVLVRLDREDIPRPLLLDLGSVTKPQETGAVWQNGFCFPAYQVPELIQENSNPVGAFSDVYGLGMTLFEMLEGDPAYPFRLRSNIEIRHDVLNKQPPAINRPDLKGIPEIASRAISKDVKGRQSDVLTFASELQRTVPKVPKERKERRVNWQILALILVGILAIILLLVMAAYLGGG